LPDPEAVCEPDAALLREPLGHALPLGERLGEPLALAEREPASPAAVALGEPETPSDARGERELLAQPLVELLTAGERDGDGEPVPERETTPEREALGQPLLVPLARGEALSLPLPARRGDGETDTLGVPELLRL